MRTRLMLAMLGLTLSTRFATAAALPTIPYEKYRLGNGLEVILAQDRSLPLVAVNLWYHVGAANEEPGRTGFAHLFEHMMFTGSKHIRRGLADELLAAAGASDSNATTSFDRTNYFDTVPSNQLELALWTHADRMGYLLDSLDQTALSNQQDVVRNERRQSYENRPYGIVDEAIFHALFPQGHPYRPAVIGSHLDIQAARLADVRDFFKRYYRPNNATLVICGDFDTATAKRLVQKQFGSFKRGAEVPTPAVTTPPLTSEQRFTVTDQIELERVDLAWLTVPKFQPGDAELSIAASILAGGKASRLYQKLVYEMQVAQDVSAEQDSYALTSVFTVEAVARAGHTAAELQPLVDAEMARLAADGPTAAEVERARNQIERALYQGLQKVGGRADRLNLYNQYLGDPGYLPKDIERYTRVTAADVQRAVREYLRTNARVVVLAVRGEKKLEPDPPAPPAPAGSGTEAINADESWRNTPPKPGPVRAPVLPQPQSFKLANGLTVLHFQRPQMPIVTAGLVVNAGLASTNPALPGVPDFAAAMLDEGTRTRNARQIAEQFQAAGGDLSARATQDSIFVSTSVLADKFNTVLPVLADVVTEASFPDTEVAIAKNNVANSLRSREAEPGFLAGRALAKVLFGDHPYSVIAPTQTSIEQTTPDELRREFARRFQPKQAVLVVVGSFDAAQAESALRDAFQTWRAQGSASVGETSKPTINLARAVYLVPRTGSVQTTLRVGAPGPFRQAADYEASEIATAIYGGMFGSRLVLNIREDKGYTYSPFAALRTYREAGFFATQADVRNAVTGATLNEINYELNRMATIRPSDTEMTQAKRYIVGNEAIGLQSGGGLAGELAGLWVDGLPPDEIARESEEIGKSTAADVTAAARKYLPASHTAVIAVGEQKVVQEELEPFGLEIKPVP